MPDEPSILVLLVGGLGESQLSDIGTRFAADPRCKVVSAGDWNGYLADLASLIEANALPAVAVIGHSFAGIPILKLITANPGLVHYFSLIDPVSCVLFVSSWAMPAQHPPFSWFRRTSFGFETIMDITGAGEPIMVEGSHNQLPHAPFVIDRLIDDILGA